MTRNTLVKSLYYICLSSIRFCLQFLFFQGKPTRAKRDFGLVSKDLPLWLSKLEIPSDKFSPGFPGFDLQEQPCLSCLTDGSQPRLKRLHKRTSSPLQAGSTQSWWPGTWSAARGTTVLDAVELHFPFTCFIFMANQWKLYFPDSILDSLIL